MTVNFTTLKYSVRFTVYQECVLSCIWLTTTVPWQIKLLCVSLCATFFCWSLLYQQPHFYEIRNCLFSCTAAYLSKHSPDCFVSFSKTYKKMLPCRDLTAYNTPLHPISLKWLSAYSMFCLRLCLACVWSWHQRPWFTTQSQHWFIITITFYSQT